MAKHWRFSNLVVLAALGMTLARSAAAVDSPVKFFSFQAGGLAVLSGGNTLTGQIAWTPAVKAGAIGIRGEVGLAPQKNVLTSYMQLNFEGFLQLSLLPFVGLDLGGGYQTFTQNLGGGAMLSAILTVSLMGPIDRVYFGFDRYLPGAGANQLKFGIGFTL